MYYLKFIEKFKSGCFDKKANLFLKIVNLIYYVTIVFMLLCFLTLISEEFFTKDTLDYDNLFDILIYFIIISTFYLIIFISFPLSLMLLLFHFTTRFYDIKQFSISKQFKLLAASLATLILLTLYIFLIKSHST
jgi:hypothetical protein